MQTALRSDTRADTIASLAGIKAAIALTLRPYSAMAQAAFNETGRGELFSTADLKLLAELIADLSSGEPGRV